ncbi:uncharacterized protein A1O9_08160 [Exophiala aquamarina CBS 119918]|uniref:Auxin efflux carrier n=1 Tax=Exophiala aquamarina CBS 119918 TaxID=1182545 RepID=A0A072PIS0_9EURO|nr:uncharacterized protein A1O9_08160 [Exophiala aquamarina CBS 119918]KEF55410.1 hypothetical protein A1O9_08160 [Exophiala aquamarina CBS 119918]
MPLADYFAHPTSFSTRQLLGSLTSRDQYPLSGNVEAAIHTWAAGGRHSSHPDFAHLTLLVFEAVLEVVCVSLPGYIVARQGSFDADSQKFLANLNVVLFTPCLIFTKLASQLTAEKLADLAIIPVIFVVQTIMSYLCAWIISRVMGFRKRQTNFVIAMGVFGNSNSLPISLVLALSKTLKGLHWDKIPHDNDNDVAARGILYLLVFQQLGQLLRWSWGYNILLAPPETYTIEEGGTKQPDAAERGRGEYRDSVDSDHEERRLLSPSYEGQYSSDEFGEDATRVGTESPTMSKSDGFKTPRTPVNPSAGTSRNSSHRNLNDCAETPDLLATPTNGMVAPHHHIDIPKWLRDPENRRYDEDCGGVKGYVNKARNNIRAFFLRIGQFFTSTSTKAFQALPATVQKALSTINAKVRSFLHGLAEFMNPPLWAMLVAVTVASIPKLQQLFFDEGTFLRNSVTRAVEQSGGVAVPLILVVLGGNLARNTIPRDPAAATTDPKEEKKLLIASLVSRMLLPTLVMAPFIALLAKYLSISILEDKIFIIVCFLLSGAPSALQLTQISAQNNVFPGLMSRILFQSYVVWILPSTLLLVMLALETVEWTKL